MFEVSVTMNFSAAHNLRGYRGKCEALHGHNWKVEATLSAEVLDKIGMAQDFTDIRRRLKKILSGLDHKHLNALPFFKKINPTSENIAKFIFEKMKTLDSARVKVACVKIWETETSCAVYRPS